MPSKSKPLTDAQLRVYESRRDLAAELLESVRQMKAGKTQLVSSPAVEALERTGLSQSQFASRPPPFTYLGRVPHSPDRVAAVGGAKAAGETAAKLGLLLGCYSVEAI